MRHNHLAIGLLIFGLIQTFSTTGHANLASGTFSDTYQFLSNGTYTFTKVNSQYAAPKYYLENEEGTYTVNGNTVQ